MKKQGEVIYNIDSMLFIERIVCQEKEVFLWLKSYSISLFGDLWIWS